MATGVVKFYNEGKGFGFIRPIGGVDIFVHIRNCDPRMDPLEEGERVELFSF